MYRNILFDLYGTLIDLKTDEERPAFWHTLALFFGYNGAAYTGENLKTRYRALVAERLEADRKTRFPDTRIFDVLKTLFQEKGVSPSEELLTHSIRLFRAASTDYLRLYPGVKELLSALKENGRRLFILSNGQREFSEPELRYLGIWPFFEALCSSAEIGICKPDPAFFHHLTGRYGLRSEECLFVGNDHLTDIAGAKAAGMDSLYIHSNQSRDVAHTGAAYEIWDGDVRRILPAALS